MELKNIGPETETIEYKKSTGGLKIEGVPECLAFG